MERQESSIIESMVAMSGYIKDISSILLNSGSIYIESQCCEMIRHHKHSSHTTVSHYEAAPINNTGDTIHIGSIIDHHCLDPIYHRITEQLSELLSCEGIHILKHDQRKISMYFGGYKQVNIEGLSDCFLTTKVGYIYIFTGINESEGKQQLGYRSI